MAKKRTTLACYGKRQQRMEQNAGRFLAIGNRDMFNFLMDSATNLFYTRRKRAGFSVPKGWVVPMPAEQGA